MGRFNMVMEAYPDLKASANMQQLTEELSSTENRISFCAAFNDAVMSYNIFAKASCQYFCRHVRAHKESRIA